MRYLELLAPARNAEIGIAAVDCGADAVYIAAGEFGARKDAGNSIEDIARLCTYAHRFGVRVFLTVNTILYDEELPRAHSLMLQAQEAGVDAFIVQDTAVMGWSDIKVPLHASTQCAIRTPEDARFYESLGCSRLVLERQLSLEQVRGIRDAVSCELEFFVHGALCVCYSGQCYLSESIDRRSANRGACIQACRSLYDLVDDSGRVLVRDKALLSLKDYRLLERLEDLAGAGVESFKIEGRLKNASYVKNVVREYSLALDELVSKFPDQYARSSFGRVSGGFTPDTQKTFNRGYTSLFIDAQRGKWSSMNAAKSMGEPVGQVVALQRRGSGMQLQLRLKPSVVLQNGDGLCFASKGRVVGFRADVCDGTFVQCKAVEGLSKGTELWRNVSAAFERELEKNMCRREIDVSLSLEISGDFEFDIRAHSADGREVWSPFKLDVDKAENRERQMSLIEGQLGKRSSIYSFHVDEVKVTTRDGSLPLLSSATLNSIRRLVAEDLDYKPCIMRPLGQCEPHPGVPAPKRDYTANVSNAEARKVYASHGVEDVAPAYELSHPCGVALMRTRYCIRYELGLCPVHQGVKDSGKLFLLNNGRRFALGFDCRNCEMTVSDADKE
jgi:23S rRNA 5-hydroxycytidine C2501 synthase